MRSSRVALILSSVVCLLYMVVTMQLWQVAHSHSVTPEAFIYGQNDSQEYVLLAREMIEHGRFAQSETADPEVFRTPGYPAFIALLLIVFGTPLALPFAQILLVAGTAVLIYALGERLFSRFVGVAAAVLYSFDPTTVFGAQVGLSEVFFVGLFVAGIFALVFPRKQRLWHVLCAAMCFGVSTLVRPIGLYIAPLILMWIVWQRRHAIRDVLVASLCFLIAFMAIVGPWMIRNDRLSGHSSLSTIGAYNALFYNVMSFESHRTGISQGQFNALMYERLGYSDFANLRSFDRYDMEFSIAREYLQPHLVSYGIFHLEKSGLFFLSSSIRGVFSTIFMLLGRQDALASYGFTINLSGLLLSGNISALVAALKANPAPFIEMLFWLCVCAASVVTVISLIVRRDSVAAPVLLFVSLMGMFAILTGPVAIARYRLPVEPLLFLLAMQGVMIVYRYVRGMLSESMREFSRYFIAALAALFVDVGMLVLYTSVLHMPYLISGAISFTLGLLLMYVLSIRWVFGTRSIQNRKSEFAIFVITGVSGLLLNEMILYLLTSVIGLFYFVSKVASVAVVFVWNFALRKILLFKNQEI